MRPVLPSRARTPRRRGQIAATLTVALVAAALVAGAAFVGLPIAQADETAPSPSPTDTASAEPTPSDTPVPSDSATPTISSSPTPSTTPTKKPPRPGVPDENPTSPSSSTNTGEKSRTDSPDRPKDGNRRADPRPRALGSDRFAIDVANNSLRKATQIARSAAHAAERAQRRAHRANVAEAATQAELRDALRAQAASDAAVARAVRLINASPTGGSLLLDPSAAAFVAADLSASPDTYLQQSQTLTNVAQTLSDDLDRANTNIAQLEAAQLETVALQEQARAASTKARATYRDALRAQRQAKQVFLRFAGRAKVGAQEAWWIDEFASSEIGRELAALDGGPRFSMRFARPTDGAVTSPYGMRMHPVLRAYKLHSGTDFGGDGSPVHASAGGVVVRAGFDVAYGNYVVVWHGQFQGESVATLYAHCGSLTVRPGDQVRRGDVLGTIGSTGYATGPHLHFEGRISGRPVDPELFVG